MSISNGKASSDIENVDWNSAGVLTNVRFGSTSSQVSQSSGDICRICHCESDTSNPLLTPCYCSGSLKYVHQTCLQQWLTASETNSCELCKFPFIMHTKIKPFNEWRSLDMSGVERRRLFCAVLFHCAAALCVIWSLCVLIERAAEEVRRGLIGWPFWTKLVVVTVGLTGGVVFMYIQCKQYLNLCNRWRARNRILLIQNAPEKFHPPQSPIMQQFRRIRTTPGCGGSLSNNSTTLGPTLRSSEAPAGNHCELQINQQGQIIAANIENNSINYERDWTLDDVSQVSFKPCPQGSGSLTPLPFHDSVHNMFDSNNTNRYSTISSSSNQQQHQQQEHSNSSEQINCSSNNKTNDLNLFKINNSELSNNSNNNNSTTIKYPNSAIFLENRDILNDEHNNEQINYPNKLYHRHSTILTPSQQNIVQADQCSHKNMRRYSDTKLLQQQQIHFQNEQKQSKQIDENLSSTMPSSQNNEQLLLNPKSIIFNVTKVLGPSLTPSTPPMGVSDEKSSTVIQSNSPQITDILFENSGGTHTFDPLELNIQEMLEIDIKNIQKLNENRRLQQHSLDNVICYGDGGSVSSSGGNNSTDYDSNFNSKRKLFKSLPNLSASSENLLP